MKNKKPQKERNDKLMKHTMILFGKKWLYLLLISLALGLVYTHISSSKLIKQLREKSEDCLVKGEKVILKDITEFKWDTLYVFGEYLNNEKIKGITGIDQVDDFYSYENQQSLIFVEDDKVVKRFTYSIFYDLDIKCNNSFNEKIDMALVEYQKYTPKNAEFIVEKKIDGAFILRGVMSLP